MVTGAGRESPQIMRFTGEVCIVGTIPVLCKVPRSIWPKENLTRQCAAIS
jgi:hypothetical protein